MEAMEVDMPYNERILLLKKEKYVSQLRLQIWTAKNDALIARLANDQQGFEDQLFLLQMYRKELAEAKVNFKKVRNILI